MRLVRRTPDHVGVPSTRDSSAPKAPDCWVLGGVATVAADIRARASPAAGAAPHRRRLHRRSPRTTSALPTRLADALSQARSLGVGFTLPHQYRGQLPPALRAGVDTNARNKIVFGLNATDAAEMAKMAPVWKHRTSCCCRRIKHGYAFLMRDGHATGSISAKTMRRPNPDL